MIVTTLPDISRRLNFYAGAQHLPPLFFVSDETRLADPGPVIARLPQGAGVIFRHYGHPERGDLAAHLRRICRVRRLLFLVAGDLRLALSVNADGIHLPEHLLGAPDNIIHHIRQRGGWITAAAHGPAALQRARRLGADAALLAPVFPTNSHPDTKTIGVVRFTDWARSAALPVYALGGVNNHTAARLLGSRCAGIAALDGLLHEGSE